MVDGQMSKILLLDESKFLISIIKHGRLVEERKGKISKVLED